MEGVMAWRQAGRGRGRGRNGAGGIPARSGPGGRGRARGVGAVLPVAAPDRGASQASELASQKKFNEIKKANQAAAKKLVEDQFSSSSEDDDEEIEGKHGKILDKTFVTYTNQTGGDASELERTRQYLNDAFQSGAMTCLICIASVKRNQAIWSCTGCFCIFHMPCIQKWAKDSVFLVSSPLTDDDFGKRDYPWLCPKCRFEYKRSETPSRYYCYCGKVEDPPLDPWLVPHSCGQVCEREFKPPCGHRCLLLCHPGPCPPCPKMVSITCYCKKAKPVPRRCSTKEWSCQLPCGRKLPCGQHNCEKPCHPGVCQPCPRVSIQSCVCGRQVAERLCASPTWQCDQICGKTLPCGYHSCEQICHGGSCGKCPRSGRRSCPCGKSKFSLPCTEDVPTCGDSCDKTLECGIHRCSQRCHRGPCETCRQEVEKQCRCGKHTKQMPCHKPYLCETKCTKIRDCQKHQCKRKGNWFVTIDLKDAYFHISIHPSHQKFIRFRFQHTTYQFAALPFGLSTAPRTFTKCMAPVVAHLRTKGIKIFPYIDDWLLVAKTYQHAIAATRTTLQVLHKLGLQINQEKSRLVPSQRVSYIGAQLDATQARAFLPPERIAKIWRAVHRVHPLGTITALDIQYLLGLMASTTSVVPHARLKLRTLQSWFLSQFDPSTDTPMKRLLVPPYVADHLTWWTFAPNLLVGRAFKPPSLSIQVTTDARPSGWGAHCQELRIHGLWSKRERTLHINQLELLAIMKAFQACLPRIEGKAVQLVTDNTTVMYYIKRQGGTRSLPLLRLTIDFWEWCLTHHIFPQGDPYLIGGQLPGRSPKQAPHKDARMVPQRHRLPGHMPQMGSAYSRPLRLPSQCEVPQILLKSRHRHLFSRRRLHDTVVRRAHLPLPSDTNVTQNNNQDNPIQNRRDSHCTMVAETTMVRPPQRDNTRSVPLTCNTVSPLSERWSHPPSRCPVPTPDGVEDNPEFRAILNLARKPSTSCLYDNKWKSFLKFTESKGLTPVPSSLSTILTFILHLLNFGLAHSTIKVYIAAIVAHQPPGSSSAKLFSHPTLKRFLKGLQDIHPPSQKIVPQWSLQLVLEALTKPPFEPMATCNEKLLSLKTAFLVAITLARRASELSALRSDSPYLQMHPDKVTLYLDMSFPPKVVSEFHVNQPIILPTFFPSPSTPIERKLHSLDMKRAIAFYLHRTNSFRRSSRLFLCYHGTNRGAPSSPQTISRWIVQVIQLAYQLAGKPVPDHLKAHSTRAVSTSTALHRGIQIQNICKAATWSNPLTFAKHYCLDVRAKNDAAFGRAILSSLLP